MRDSLLACVALSFLITNSIVQADVDLITPEVTVTLSPAKGWTVDGLTYAGRAYIEPVGSGQGTVVYENGRWVGSVHAAEAVLAAQLLVDGREVELIDGQAYAGDTISFTRRSVIGESYRLRSTLTITGDQVSEHVQLQRIGSQAAVSVVYGFLGSRANRLTNYAAFDADGVLLAFGTTALDDRRNTQLGSATAVAQFDPVGGDGVLTTIVAGSELGLEQFIWDRLEDNKLYSRFRALEGPGQPGQTFEIQQRLQFFDAAPGAWTQTAAALVPEPATITTLLVAGSWLLTIRRRR